MNIREQFHQELDKWIRRKKDKHAWIDAIPDLPPECEPIITMHGELRIGLPLDPPLIKKVREILAADGWELEEERLSGDYQWVRFSAEKRLPDEPLAVLDVTAFEWKKGSTCEIKAIGKETVEQTIYEVVCKDGADEPVKEAM